MNKYFLNQLIGKGYDNFWFFKGRYRIVKGSRASKKSRTTAYWIIINMMDKNYKLSNTLVIRKTKSTLKNSCFAELLWVIHHLKLEKYWKWTRNPLEIIYRPTGQKILFRGLDDPLKLASISVPFGYICWVWIEEAYEITDEHDFQMLDESIRGNLPFPLFHQFTLTFNPWTSNHWLKSKFFDVKDEDILAMTTTYQMNEWIDPSYIKMLTLLKETNPQRYQVSALGEWGTLENKIYENYQKNLFNPKEVNGIPIYGLDFGYSKDPTAFFVGKIDLINKKLYVIDEFYEKKLLNNQIAEKIIQKGCQHKKIYADCSSPKDITELSQIYNIEKIVACRKGKDSLLKGIKFIQDYHILIHPSCKYFFFEIENYTYKKDPKKKQYLPIPEDHHNHLMDAMRYALEPFIMN